MNNLISIMGYDSADAGRLVGDNPIAAEQRLFLLAANYGRRIVDTLDWKLLWLGPVPALDVENTADESVAAAVELVRSKLRVIEDQMKEDGYAGIHVLLDRYRGTWDECCNVSIHVEFVPRSSSFVN